MILKMPAPASEDAQLALDTILHEPVKGIPSWLLNVMEHEMIDALAGCEPGSYRKEPEATYIAMQRRIGTCFLDQYIPTNPLSMTSHGYDGAEQGVTTGAGDVTLDGILIDGPEAVCEHLERVVFPALEKACGDFDEDSFVHEIIAGEMAVQERLGKDILKGPYGIVSFPTLSYYAYGYQHYFSAYALYPEVMEKHFSLQADLSVKNNRAAVRAITEGCLPPLVRLDHDMADSRGMLVRIESLDDLWMPHFVRSIQPVLDAGIAMIWHCDGNLMDLVPRLLEAGISGFQGFQYEDGMDYKKICAMKDHDDNDLTIIAGVSVTRTLPMGKPSDVKDELKFLVENGPKTGLFLGASSSIAPGVSLDNLNTLVEGLKHYKKNGRGAAA